MINILMINMFEQFFNRERELDFLERAYRSQGFELIVVYGRRRVGKTFLMKKFLQGKRDAAYFYVSDASPATIRSQLAEKIYEQLGIRMEYAATWAQIFTKLFRAAKQRRIVIVFDEFQRLLDIDRSAISELQRAVDEESQSSKLMIVCTGSSIGLMERMFHYGQPLYGRATGILKIKPFNFSQAYSLLAAKIGANPVEAAELYGLLGGTPYYLSLARSTSWLKEAERLLFNNTSPLYWEPELLLKTELREHATYFEILRLLAAGKNSFSELAGSLGTSKTSLSYYLNVLIKDLDLVEREEPIGGGRPIYKIKDNYFKFWFRYVFPHMSALEMGEASQALEHSKEDHKTYMGQIFQEIVKQAAWHLKMPFKPARVGSWWKKGTKIDVVAVDARGRQAALIETKWRKLSLKQAQKTLQQLEQKAAALPYPVKHYGIAAITIENPEKLRDQGYLAYQIQDIASADTDFDTINNITRWTPIQE